MKQIVNYFLTASISLTCAAAFAMPPRSGLLSVHQHDGSTIEAKLYGNENQCKYVSPNGEELIPDKDGYLRPTGSKFKNAEAIYQTLKYSGKNDINSSISTVSQYPTTGKIKTLVILAEFSDMSFFSENPKDIISRMISQKDFNEGDAKGSVRDYFTDNSSGEFELDPIVIGPVILPNKMAYYGAADGGKADVRPEEMIRDACMLVDNQINFADFDLDSDGYIDNVYVFYPGYSQADGAETNTIWPHSGFAYNKLRASFDGVKLDRYACSNEIDISTGMLVGIGTFCHEFSHVLGLPDLYATDYSNEEHPGTWSIMATGGRNNNGHTPPAFSAYERYALGWLNPEKLEISEEDFTLQSQKNRAFIIPTQSGKEFFIIENRQQSGWDTYLPGHGMLIWHIDYDENVWRDNTVNNDATHQRIDLIEADRNSSSTTRSGDSYPGSADTRELSIIKTWANASLGTGLFNIRESDDGTIRFNMFNTTDKLPTPTALNADEISSVSFRANWEKIPQASSYTIEVYKKVRNGSVITKVYADGYRLYRAGNTNSAIINGLETSTTYYYVVRAIGDSRISDYSAECSATTLEPDFRSSLPEGAEATNITADSFTANWNNLPGATSYMITVSEVELGTSYSKVNDFTDGTIAIDGWTASSSCTTSSFSGYYGKVAPGLNMSTDEAFVCSPIDKNFITSVKFWYRGVSTDYKNEVRLYGYDGRIWRNITNIAPLKTDRAGTEVTIEKEFADIPYYAVKIIFHKPGSKGILVIDDITVCHTRTTSTVLPSYDNYNVGNSLSVKINGLKASTLYRYTVRATDGNFLSLASTPRSAQTLSDAGVLRINNDNLNVGISTSDDKIEVLNRGNKSVTVEIFSISGIKLLHRSLDFGASAQLPASHGIYIVTVNGIPYKIAL